MIVALVVIGCVSLACLMWAAIFGAWRGYRDKIGPNSEYFDYAAHEWRKTAPLASLLWSRKHLRAYWDEQNNRTNDKP